ncbi:urea transporter [Bacillus sp. S/N-304-OC-R1]|uniref:urea transporter n=1 Tax=Bacillus sp. S/N-304-OC-R1 TaxID=2758034 RepID=UPI001C8E6A43|nr:urea transporter [Bacillus sp. S/N-304-OC-R1]MBY0120391.1 urea transporter [Bacillus sp. S/N-304-OC-R1]
MNKTNQSFTLRGSALSFITASLKGISQVILIENAISGLIILLAIMVSSIFEGIIALLSAFIGTFIGKIGGMEEQKVNQGLLGYNSVLTGMALMLFLTGSNRWIFALGGAAIAAIFTAAIVYLMRNTGIPILTFPFIVLTWIILLTPYKLHAINLSPELEPQNLSVLGPELTEKVDFIEGIFNGIGQIYLLDEPLSGILLFVAVFFAGWKLGLYAILGNITALIFAYFLGAEHTLMMLGLYGYNAILTILAVSAVFNEKQNFLTVLIGIISACLAVLITASVDALLIPFGLPALTMPFVLATWIILCARKVMPFSNIKEKKF